MGARWCRSDSSNDWPLVPSCSWREAGPDRRLRAPLPARSRSVAVRHLRLRAPPFRHHRGMPARGWVPARLRAGLRRRRADGPAGTARRTARVLGRFADDRGARSAAVGGGRRRQRGVGRRCDPGALADGPVRPGGAQRDRLLLRPRRAGRRRCGGSSGASTSAGRSWPRTGSERPPTTCCPGTRSTRRSARRTVWPTSEACATRGSASTGGGERETGARVGGGPGAGRGGLDRRLCGITPGGRGGGGDRRPRRHRRGRLLLRSHGDRHPARTAQPRGGRGDPGRLGGPGSRHRHVRRAAPDLRPPAPDLDRPHRC